MSNQPYSYDGLEPKYIEIAKKELHEDPKKVHAHIASLRTWLSQSKHILNCPDNDAFLLRFLRAAKFDHEKAQGRLENFCTLRASEELGVPFMFNFPSLDDSMLLKVLRMGFMLPCGYNSKGEMVLLCAMKGWDPDEISYIKMLPYVYMQVEVFLADPRSQIAGISCVVDLGSLSKKHMDTMMASQKVLKDEMRVWQEGCPMRNREFYYYREPVIFDIFFNIMQFWMKEKLKKRLHRVKNDLKKIHDRMPGAKEILPMEYGGTNGTIAELTAKWEKQFFDFWSKPYECKDLKVDESLRPKDSLKFLKDYADLPDDLAGTKGTYTRLNVD